MVMRGSSMFNRRGIQRIRQLIVSAKVKILFGCCIVLTLLAIANRSPDVMGWNNHSVFLDQSKGYAILINTWKRYHLLKQSITHYSSCVGIDSIHVVWSEPDPPADTLVEYLNHVVELNSRGRWPTKIVFDINKQDSLNNRFKEINNLKADAVFSIDDDVIFSCSSVEFAFNVWQSAPDTMVGFVPRTHWLDRQEKHKEDYYTYGGWWSVWWTGRYSMVLSKAAFFHKKYLSLYSNEMPASIREYTTKNRNCEDIAMSFLIANATGAPPIWVKGKIHEIGSSGISTIGGHTKRRTECVNKFVAEYGRMPLVTTTLKAVDSRSLWFW